MEAFRREFRKGFRMPKRLTKSQIEQYGRAGYLAPLRVLDRDEAEVMRRALETFEAQNEGPLKGAKRFKSHLLFRWLADLVRAPHLVDAVEDRIGPDILCWSTQLWIKEPHSEQFVSWHQDSQYWGVDTDSLVSAWVALCQRPSKADAYAASPAATRVRACPTVKPGTTTTC